MNIDEIGFGPTEANLDLDENTSGSKNPFTGGTRVTRLPGAKYVLTASYQKLMPHEANFMDAYVGSTQGGATIVRVRDLSYTHPGGARNGAPKVSAVAEDGNTLTTNGWAAGIPGQLLIGDRFSFIDPDSGLEEIHVVTGVVNSDGAGVAILNFCPELKRLPPVGTAINITEPGMSARCTKAKVARSGLSSTASFTWEEAIYAL